MCSQGSQRRLMRRKIPSSQVVTRSLPGERDTPHSPCDTLVLLRHALIHIRFIIIRAQVQTHNMHTRSLYGPPQTPVRNNNSAKSPWDGSGPVQSLQTSLSLASSQSSSTMQASQAAPAAPSPPAPVTVPSLQATGSDRDLSVKDVQTPVPAPKPPPLPIQQSKIIDALLNGTPMKSNMPGSSLQFANSLQLGSSLQYEDSDPKTTPLRPVSLVGLQASSSKTRADSPVGSVAPSITASSSRKSKPFVQHGEL
jgi:hypothetical protein